MMVASMGQYANRVGGGGREVVFSAVLVDRVKQQRVLLDSPPRRGKSLTNVMTLTSPRRKVGGHMALS